MNYRQATLFKSKSFSIWVSPSTDSCNHGKKFFSEKKVRLLSDLIKCLKLIEQQILLHTCAPSRELTFYISTERFISYHKYILKITQPSKYRFTVLICGSFWGTQYHVPADDKIFLQCDNITLGLAFNIMVIHNSRPKEICGFRKPQRKVIFLVALPTPPPASLVAIIFYETFF